MEALTETETVLALEQCSFYDALAIVESTDNWYDHISKEVLPVATITSLITFENSHEVAYGLYHSNPEAALALFNELEYYIKGQPC
jgi:hypothetical protein